MNPARIFPRLVRGIQSVLIYTALFFTYYILFGATRLFCLLLNRNKLAGGGRWRRAEGYEPDMKGLERGA